MAEMKPTEGTWRVGRHPMKVETEAGQLVADCFVPGLPMTECVANARLCSAAKAMLEALKAVVRVADRNTVEFDAARAAIAKAEAQEGDDEPVR